VTGVTEQEFRTLRTKEWLLMAASLVSLAGFFVVGLFSH
jgi:hypothetical protein